MSKNAKNKVSRIKVKKKLWCRINAPKIFGQKELGEAYLSSPEKAVGRVMKVNLRDLTGNIKDQKVYVSFKIDKADGSTLNTSVIGCEMTPTSVKRSVRKNTDKIEDYLILKTKNGDDVVVKSMIVTSFKTQRSVRKQIRDKLKEILSEETGKSDFSTFMGNLVNRKVQSGAKKTLHKIYPVKEVALRKVILKSRKSNSSTENAGKSSKDLVQEEGKTSTVPKNEETA